MNNQTDWLSIIDYSHASGLSISTLRRRIKRKQIDFQEIGGKYFIRAEVTKSNKAQAELSTEVILLRLEVEKLQRQLHQLREENNDLKMLVDIYERSSEQATAPSLISENELPAIPNLQ